MDGPRLFTLEEATNLLPRVRELVAEMQEARRQAETSRQEFERLDATHARGNGYDMKREGLAAQIVEYMKSVRQGLEALQEIGCELKDLEAGLVDFPSQRQGQTVNLCWQIGEEKIGYWHSLDKTFADRQPL